jgi:hypothetical protein
MIRKSACPLWRVDIPSDPTSESTAISRQLHQPPGHDLCEAERFSFFAQTRAGENLFIGARASTLQLLYARLDTGHAAQERG